MEVDYTACAIIGPWARVIFNLLLGFGAARDEYGTALFFIYQEVLLDIVILQ